MPALWLRLCWLTVCHYSGESLYSSYRSSSTPSPPGCPCRHAVVRGEKDLHGRRRCGAGAQQERQQPPSTNVGGSHEGVARRRTFWLKHEVHSGTAGHCDLPVSSERRTMARKAGVADRVPPEFHPHSTLIPPAELYSVDLQCEAERSAHLHTHKRNTHSTVTR